MSQTKVRSRYISQANMFRITLPQYIPQTQSTLYHNSLIIVNTLHYYMTQTILQKYIKQVHVS